MSVLGLGHDVVDVSAFAEQLAEPGSRMRGLFSVREVRQAGERARRKNDDESTHLAAKWAGKEAVLKAWCDALGDMPNPYTIENFPWNGIESWMIRAADRALRCGRTSSGSACVAAPRSLQKLR